MLYFCADLYYGALERFSAEGPYAFRHLHRHYLLGIPSELLQPSASCSAFYHVPAIYMPSCLSIMLLYVGTSVADMVPGLQQL